MENKNENVDDFEQQMASKMVHGDEEDEKAAEEFLQQHAAHAKRQQRIFEKAFKTFDSDGDGYISAEDLRSLMGNIDENWTDDEIDGKCIQAKIEKNGKNLHIFFPVGFGLFQI